MWNQWGLGLHLIFVTIFLVATTTNTCFGARNTSVACFEHERIALLEFKHSVTDRFEMLSSWVGNDCCQWERVQCDVVSGHVETLHLRGFINYHYASYESEEYLVGNEVKSSLAELSQLKYLDLSRNSFYKSKIPEFIGSFKHLTYLNLSNAYFSGNIPYQIGNLSNLKVLDLNSKYTDRLLIVDDMAWISGLSSLKYIDLSFVDLRRVQNHDMVFYMIPSLEELRLSECDISGNIPHLNSNATHSNIKHLDLGFNNFKGQLPGFFQNMSSLKFLDLSFFNLSMPWNFANLLNIIPSLQEVHLSYCGIQNIHLSPTYLNFSTLSNIQLLDLSRNSFEGKFPSVLTNLSSLRVLDLSWNSFEGKFPSVLTNLSSLRVLDLSGCSLNSTVPIMPNLLDLDLSYNDFKHIEQLGIWRQCHLKQLRVIAFHFDIQMNDSPTTNVSECSQYALERLHFHGSLNGTIPGSLGRLTNLKVLDLSYNELNGSIPESLGKLTNLEVLDLSYNELNGSIPESLGKLTNLRGLDLSSNKLKGPIPESLVRLRLLEELDLSGNQLNGSIPESLGRLATLKYLSLSYNHLTSSIPTSLGRLVSLQSFSVSSNLLNGTIPVQVGQLTNLHYLHMSNNFLEGVVSEAHFYNLSMLEDLYLANNKLIVNISREWMPSFRLLRIDLSFCKIEDEFPKWLRTQRNLKFLRLSNNSISGTLPTWLRKMPIIPHLDLSHNNLSGPLTNLPIGDQTYDISHRLFLQNNLFNESIPWSLCRRKNLRHLDLSRNRLTGKIPKCLGNLQQLYAMIFSSNRLSGVIPSSIAPPSSSLSWLNLNDNNLGGVLPRELGNLRNLYVLDVGDNKLSGNIPKWIGEKLRELVIFRLHKNHFTGQIPPSLCRNSNLQILDVAHNNLRGPIPHCLGSLNGMITSRNRLSYRFDTVERVIQVIKGVELEYTTTLEFVTNMDLSSNKLVGGIPTELTALSSLAGLNLSNNILSGCIPDNIGNMDGLISLDFSGNQLYGTIPPSMAALHFLSHLNLSHNNLSGRIPTGNQLQTLIDPSIYVGNKDLCGAPLPRNCSNHEDLTTHNKAANEPKKVWFYLDVACGFATGFWGIIGVLVLKKEWRHKVFMFAEVTMDKIYVAVMVRVGKMKIRNDAA